MKCLAKLVAGLALAVGAWAATDPFAGVWSDGRLTLTLTGGKTQYTGSFALEGESMPLAATAGEGRLQGSFTSNGATFPFQAERDGDSLRVRSEGASYELSRTTPRPVNPLVRGSEPAAATAPASAPVESTADTEEGWTESGRFRFRLPEGWTAEAGPTGAVSLSPPDKKKAKSETDEVYVITPMRGVSTPDDPALDNLIRQTMLGDKGASAVYSTEAFEPAGDGATRHTWRILQRGRRLDAYVKRSRGRIIAVVATGLEKKIGRRRADIRRLAEAVELRADQEPPVAQVEPPRDVQSDPQAPPFEAGVVSDGKPESEAWKQRLSGKVLTRIERARVAPGARPIKSRLLLRADGEFEYTIVSQLPPDAAAAGIGAKHGWWRILTHSGRAYLAVVVAGEAKEEYFPLLTRGAQTYLGPDLVIISAFE